MESHKSKNKTKFLILMVLTLVFFLLTSCRAEAKDPTAPEELAYVRFNEAGKAVSEVETTPYSSLYWFYTAVKADGTGNSGETKTETLVNTTSDYKGLSESVGPFSQGKWKFTLTAYSEATVTETPETDGASKLTATPTADKEVFKSGAFEITLAGGETKNVAVSVTPCGTTGKVTLSGAYVTSAVSKLEIKFVSTAAVTGEEGTSGTKTYTYTYTASTGDTETLSVGSVSDGKYPVEFTGTDKTVALAVGTDGSATYKCTVTLTTSEDNNSLQTNTFYIAVYSGGAETEINGNLMSDE